MQSLRRSAVPLGVVVYLLHVNTEKRNNKPQSTDNVGNIKFKISAKYPTKCAMMYLDLKLSDIVPAYPAGFLLFGGKSS